MSEWRKFWFEPWRWADPGWHRLYAAAHLPVRCEAARLAFAGWIDTFRLEREWRQPEDARWLQLCGIEPEALRTVATVLGWIAILRAPGGWPHARGIEADPVLRWAFRYRDVNWIDIRAVDRGMAAYDAQASGLQLLLLAAKSQWPDIGRRLQMMPAPHAIAGDGALAVIRLDGARCLTLSLAVARRLAAGESADAAGSLRSRTSGTS
jgi:hypothetical protein